MRTIAPLFIAASASVVMLLGLVHLVYTFHGPNLTPRDRELTTRMQQVPLVVSRETTVWRTWVGFNASHSCSLILFGAVYGYLSLAYGSFLMQSAFLQAVGLLFLLSYAVLARCYWFNVPFYGMAAATALYAGALLIRRT